MEKLFLLLLTVVGCCLVDFSHCTSCTVNAPEISLVELHRGCYHTKRSREPDCVAAMHRYCYNVAYPTSITTLGVQRERVNSRIGMSCVKSRLVRDVPITELKTYHPGCTIGKSQHRDCLAAIHRYCAKQLGSNFAGTSQEVGKVLLQVHCFESSRNEDVPLVALQHHHPGCKTPFSDSSDCFSAASRWCQSLGHSGGITQEVNGKIMTVACYRAEYVNDAFTTRVADFYSGIMNISRVCSLDFTVDQRKILSSTPEVLKAEMSDNRKSNVTLSSSFQISKEIKESHTFTHEHGFTFGVSATYESSLPFFSAETTVSFSTSHKFSFTEENTMTSSYSTTSTINIPPGTAIMKKAVITRVQLDVPWTAKIVNALGSKKTIGGMWKGVNTYDFKVMQENI